MASIICPDCGSSVSTDAQSCTNCGKPANMMQAALPIAFPRDDEHVGKVCSYCQSPIKPGDQVQICTDCQAPHHQECWEENHGCTTYGCRMTNFGAESLPESAASLSQRAASFETTVASRDAVIKKRWNTLTIVLLITIIVLLGYNVFSFCQINNIKTTNEDLRKNDEKTETILTIHGIDIKNQKTPLVSLKDEYVQDLGGGFLLANASAENDENTLTISGEIVNTRSVSYSDVDFVMQGEGKELVKIHLNRLSQGCASKFIVKVPMEVIDTDFDYFVNIFMDSYYVSWNY